MPLLTSEAGAKAGPGDLRRGDPGSDRPKGSITQRRGSLARTIYKRRRHGRVHVSVEPASAVEGLNRVFDDDPPADAHVVWIQAEYGWPYVEEPATGPLREPARHLAMPAVHVVLRPDGSFLVGVSPRPRGERPPLTFFDVDKAAAYSVWLAKRHGTPASGPLQIFTGTA